MIVLVHVSARKVLQSELSVGLWRHLVHFGQTCLCNISLLQPDPVFPGMGHGSDLGRASWPIWQLKSSFLKSRPTKPLHQYQPPKWATACLVMGCSEMTPSFLVGTLTQYSSSKVQIHAQNPSTTWFWNNEWTLKSQDTRIAVKAVSGSDCLGRCRLSSIRYNQSEMSPM